MCIRDRGRRVAVALGQFEVVAVALQGALGQVLAAFAVGVAAGVVVVFQLGSVSYTHLEWVFFR